MDMDDLKRKRQQYETNMHEQIQESLNKMKEDLNKTNEEVSRQVNNKVENTSQPNIPEPEPEPDDKPTVKERKPLIYFSYPMSGYTEPPAWTGPLRQILGKNGYLVYNPFDAVNVQYGQADLTSLNTQPLKIVKSLCSVLYIPEEVLLPFEAIWQLIEQGDKGDNYGIVFQCLWFLTRSSLVICDLMRQMAGAGTAQELLYSRQLNIPVVGLFPSSGQLNPFSHRSTTVLFSGTELLALLPIIRGYAPIN